MKETYLIRDLVRRIIKEGKAVSDPTARDAEWEVWWGVVSKNLRKESGWNPRDPKIIRGGQNAYNSGYTASEFEEEWLASMGLL